MHACNQIWWTVYSTALIFEQRGLDPSGPFNECDAFEPISSVAELEEGGLIGKIKLL
jgi:hypothetical protein